MEEITFFQDGIELSELPASLHNNINEFNKQFNRRECNSFKKKEDDRHKDPATNEEVCECSRTKTWHDNKGLPTLSHEEMWTVQQHTTKIPCDAHGVMKLKGYSRVPKQAKPKYICVDALTENFEPLWELMTKKWSMGCPDLILSINGGAKLMKGLSEKLTKELKEGIRGVVSSCSHIWIITSGFQTGVARLVGEAMKSEFDLFSQDSKVAVIGMCTWGVVNNKESLITTGVDYKLDGRGLPIVMYKSGTVGKGLSVFEPNHTHFILCDDGKEKTYGADILFRPRFENFIRDKIKESGNSPAPVVQIVIEGGKNTMKTAYESLKAGTPVVFIEGSGRAADFLPQIVFKIKPEMSRSEAKTLVEEQLDPDFWFLNKNETEEWTDFILDMAFLFKEQFHVFNINGLNENLDKAILLAVFRDSTDKDVKLKLAMKMNRFDLAEQEIFNDDRTDWRNDLDMNVYMEMAILNDLVEFVEIFLNNGVNLSEFFTKERISRFYDYYYIKENDIPKYTSQQKVDSRDAEFFRHLMENHVYNCGCFTTKHDREVVLPQVGELISKLVGRAFKNPYKYPETIEKKDYRRKDLFESNEDPSSSSSSRKKYPTYPQYKKFSGNNEMECKLHRVYGEQDLFFFCLLTHHYKLATLFCRLDVDPIATALVGVGIVESLKKEAKQRGEVQLVLEMERLGSLFQQMATGALEVAYSYERTRSHLLLTRSLPHYGRHTSLSYANNHECQEFLHHTACQSKLNNIWLGAIPKSKRIFLIVLNLFFSLFFIRLIFSWRKSGRIKASSNDDYKGVLDPVFVSTRGPSAREDHEFISAKVRVRNMSYRSANLFIRTFEAEQIAGFRNISYFKSIVLFYRAPITKFLLYMISNIVFLCLLSYVTLLTLKPLSAPGQPSVIEYLVWIWFITYLVEEMRQALYGGPVNARFRASQWIHSNWNKYDIMLYSMFMVTTVFRLTLSPDNFVYARNLQCFCLSLFFIRFMRFYYAHKSLGPKVIMIYRMINDVFFFMGIYIIFLLAYGTLSQGLQYPNQPEKWVVLKNVFYKPYWQTYGELDLESVEGDYYCNATDGSCAHHAPLNVVAFVFYMLFTNILLINLLIAMFGYTFSKIQSSSEKLWAFNRYELVTEFYERSFLPPPLSLISIIVEIFKFLGKKCCGHRDKLEDNDFVVYLNKEEDSNLTTFSRKCMDACWTRLCELKQTEIKDTTSKKCSTQPSENQVLSEKLSQLESYVIKMNEKLDLLMNQQS